MTGLEPCIKLFVQTVAKNVKSHSNPQKEGQSTVENAIEIVDHHEEATADIRILVSNVSEIISMISTFIVLTRMCTMAISRRL